MPSDPRHRAVNDGLRILFRVHGSDIIVQNIINNERKSMARTCTGTDH